MQRARQQLIKGVFDDRRTHLCNYAEIVIILIAQDTSFILLATTNKKIKFLYFIDYLMYEITISLLMRPCLRDRCFTRMQKIVSNICNIETKC